MWVNDVLAKRGEIGMRWTKIVVLLTCNLLALSGCGEKEADKSGLQEAMDSLNNPGNLPDTSGPLERNIDRLPTAGYSAIPVWTGNWWPYSAEGTAHRPQPRELSPLEKYDAAMGNDASATRWELAQAAALKAYTWAGHCNGLAAAGIMEKEPKRGVSFRNVYFSVEDLKALLVEVWQGGGTLVGGRCNSQQVSYDRHGRMLDNLCRDINPAAFHLDLYNFLGRWRKPVIIDIAPLAEVWNYPIVSYTQTAQRALSTREATFWLTRMQYPDYPYNPDALSFRYIETEITLAAGNRFRYAYILELDADGNIIGGEWFGKSKQVHPDFIWRHSWPPTPENPYVNPAIVRQIIQSAF